MNAPPPIPSAPRRKLINVIVIVCGVISTITLVILLVGYLDREGIIMFRKNGPRAYFYPADLKSMNLPPWYITNAMPLTPDQAVLSAIRHLSTKHPNVVSWDVDSIDLRKEFDATWTYSISLIDRRSGRYEFEVIKVLMDGSIWTPTTKRLER